MSEADALVGDVEDGVVVVEEGEAHDPEAVVFGEVQVHDLEDALVSHVRDVVVLRDQVHSRVDLDHKVGVLFRILFESAVARKQVVEHRLLRARESRCKVCCQILEILYTHYTFMIYQLALGRRMCQSR